MSQIDTPRSSKTRLLGWKTLTAISLLVLGTILVLLVIRTSLTDLSHAVALEQAEQYTSAIEEFRSLYTSEIVARVKTQGVRVVHDYERFDGAIPLPATLSMLLGDRLAETTNGGTTRLYSAYPFPWRQTEGGPRDEFERQALERLTNDPTSAVHRFEHVNGVASVRIAKADVMRPQCVNCHNSHPETPRTGWKEGDVRGVLTATIPLHGVEARTEGAVAELWGAVLALLCGSLVGIAIVVRGATRQSVRLVARENELQREAVRRSEAELERSKYADLAERHRESETRLRAILETAAEAVVTIDPDGNIQSFNRAAADMFGYEENEVIDRNVQMLMPGTTAEKHNEYLNRCAREEGRRVIGMRRIDQGLRRDGSVFPISLAISEIPRKNGSAGFAGIISDLTEERALESQLAQAQKLESIGQLAAGIAHEINTPAQFVSDNLEFLDDSLSDLAPVFESLDAVLASQEERTSPELVKLREVVEKADLDFLGKELPGAVSQSRGGIARVAEIVKAMKDFSHPGAEGFQCIDLNRAIESTVTVARNEWKYVADLEFDLDGELPQVSCHAGEINQCVLNILVNAAHAIDARRGDSSTLGNIRISTSRDGDYARVEIQDDGGGIPVEAQSRVFDPFFTTKGVGKGTGQGLSIAYTSIVEKHGGTLAFEVEADVGTTFIIRLPLERVDSNGEGKGSR